MRLLPVPHREPASPTTCSTCLSRRQLLQSMALGAIFPSVPLLGTGVGCASSPALPRKLVQVPGSPPFVVSQPRPSVRAVARGDDDTGAFAGAWIPKMLPTARQAVEAAGFRFRARVAVVAYREVREFVEATGKTNARLRAWSTWDQIHLLDRSFWRDGSDRAAKARLTHELVHVGMFQTFRTPVAAKEARLPFFFVEGAASVIAQQEFARMPLSLVKAQNASLPLGSAAGPEAYAAAHHAGAHLAKTHSLSIFFKLTKRAADIGGPQAFTQALEELTALSPQQLWQATLDAG